MQIKHGFNQSIIVTGSYLACAPKNITYMTASLILFPVKVLRSTQNPNLQGMIAKIKENQSV